MLAGLGEQLTNAEIAARMYVSERTVETHVSSLLRKLQASNRRELGRTGGQRRCDVDGRRRHDRTVGNGHLPVHRCRGLDCARGSGTPSLMPEVLARHDAVVQDGDHASPGPHLHQPRVTDSAPPSRRPRRLSLLRSMPSGHWGRSRGRATLPSACGWDCTAARRRSETATTSVASSTAPPASPCDRARRPHPVVGGDCRPRR